jgi:hypothetical protein
MSEQNENNNNGKDFIDRKIGGFESVFVKFFDAVQKDIKSFFIVILVLTNIIIFYKYVNSLETRLDDNKVYSDKIIEEIKNQLRPEINENIERKTQKIETKVDSASNSLEELKEVIINKLK